MFGGRPVFRPPFLFSRQSYFAPEVVMMQMRPVLLAAFLFLLSRSVSLFASGPVGIFGIIEKVLYEPNASAPERLQVWGAFSYVEGANQSAVQVSNITRGYLYFRLPSIDLVDAREVD